MVVNERRLPRRRETPVLPTPSGGGERWRSSGATGFTHSLHIPDLHDVHTGLAPVTASPLLRIPGMKAIQTSSIFLIHTGEISISARVDRAAQEGGHLAHDDLEAAG